MNAENAALAHAMQGGQQETCGLVVRTSSGERFLPCDNVAPDPETTFLISPDDWICAAEQGDITAVVHSHPDNTFSLSPADRISQKDTGLAWWLIAGSRLRKFRNVAPLLGRSFFHGKMDCYTLFRDAYHLAGFDFPDFERADDWWDGSDELYLDHMPEYGFQRVTEPQPGDIILMQLKSDRANHAAIYLGHTRILHHLPDRLSGRDLYGGYYLRHTHSIWRHQQWQSSDFMAIYNDLDAFSGSMYQPLVKPSGR